MKYLVVAVEYFTKWIEAEPVAQITAHKIQNFVWKNIVCRFGVPKRLVSDNGTQFASHLLKKLCYRLVQLLIFLDQFLGLLILVNFDFTQQVLPLN